MRPLIVFLFIMIQAYAAWGAQPKNIIFILADDLGWNDTSIYQENTFYETPNIDALAQKGMTFTHAFSNSPLCSPTRASILTGQTPARHGILNPNIETPAVRLNASERQRGPSNQPSTAPLTATRLDTAIPTLAKVLKSQNYKTAHFGKWHLGDSPYSALEHGFDIDIPHFSGSGPYGGYFAPWRFAPNLVPTEPGEHIDARLAKEARQWILNNHTSGPFFVNFWPFSVHAPFDANQNDVNHFIEKRSPYNSQRSATYAAMIKHFDDAIAILYSALVDAGIENDTIIVFTSDNGGNMYDVLGEIHPTSNFPLRGGKATQFDGGSRVPTFIIWPGLTQTNTLSATPIQTVDFYPTLLNGLNIDTPSEHIVDGDDIRPVLQGETIAPRPIITYYPTMPRIPDWLPPSATIIYDGWKLIKTFYYGTSDIHRYALYNISQDVGEANNLSHLRPDKLLELDSILSSYLDNAGAALPLENPDYRTGAFNVDAIGKPADQYLLPEERVASRFAINLASSDTDAKAGDTVTVTWQVAHAQDTATINYRQFMGPDTELVTQENAFSFVAPEVYTKTFVGFAFIAKSGGKTIRKQIAVGIEPVNVAPTLSLSSATLNAKAGSDQNISYTISDENKDRLTLHAKSTVLSLDEQLDVTDPIFSFEIPNSLADTTFPIEFTVSDGHAEQSKVLQVTVSRLNQESGSPKSTSGGGALTWLLMFLCAGVWTRRVKRR